MLIRLMLIAALCGSMGCATLLESMRPPPAAPAPLTPQERRQAYLDAHPELAKDVRQAIMFGRVVEGMVEAEVRASLGRAQEEQVDGMELYWRYRKTRTVTRTTFENGRQTQTSREVPNGMDVVVFREQDGVYRVTLFRSI